MTTHSDTPGTIGIVGGGPSGLVLAIALARRGLRSTVFERDVHPQAAPRFNPDRSYTIDISGHGLKALRHIDACSFFDERLIHFKGLKVPGGQTEAWKDQGWTGSRGDIMRALMAKVDEQHADMVSFEFGCRVEAVDVRAGAVMYTDGSGVRATRTFDLVVGADGAGSVVRRALQDQVAWFSVESKSLPEYCTMIELDRVGDQLDREYLHGLASIPFVVAGAIKGDDGPDSSRWFCAVGTRAKAVYGSADEARAFFLRRCPRVLDLTSDAAVAAFAQRECYHIGRKLTCSQLDGGKAVLLGDAAAPFPPIGQGLNAAMESAMTLDLCIGLAGHAPPQLLEATRLYTTRWKPEADAASWISEKSLFENRYHTLRALATMRLGLNIASEAKSPVVPYSEVKRKAERMWPLWAN
jgi:2-polyprenyl-6-methoxyphenol hydroxylase-like FAD-dependent oxidoreductase